MVSRRTSLLLALAVLALGLVAAPGASATTPCFDLTPTITGDGEVTGTSGNDIIVTGDGDDQIDGGGGRDIVCAGAGNDTIVTHEGNDFAFGQDGDDDISAADGNDFVEGGRGTDTCDAGSGTNRVYGCTNPTTFLVGQSAPDIVSRTAFDNRFRLADLAGQNVLIDFSGLWCSPSNAMASAAAGVQATLRKAKVPFTYVLGEVQGFVPGAPSARQDAERISETWGLGQSPVLHAESVLTTDLTTAFLEFSSENVSYETGNGPGNNFLPTMVFINTAGVVTELDAFPLQPQEILDRIKTGLTAPAPIDSVEAPLTGVYIESLRSMLDSLTISAASKATLQGQLTNALRAMEVRLKPKTSACDWMKQFDGALKKTTGIGAADRADLVAASKNIKSKLGCK